jgi:hypothetical protein
VAGSAVTLSLVAASLLVTPGVSAQCGGGDVGSYDGGGKGNGHQAQPMAVQITGGTITNETVIDVNANAGTAISDASGGSYNIATTSSGSSGTDVASSGNGGVANASANGGAISIQDINSGGNSGNAISVGNTTCAPYTPPAAPEKPGKQGPAPEKVVALPVTGVGGFGDPSPLFALIASASAAVSAFGLRRR